ncbi:MAG: PIN domain-containing protein [Betaproteobacteria bacterium]|nr:PIN domain-containing protein [Betaproteobacteria bacterium]
MPAFADTNVVVYAFGQDDTKVAVAESILENQPTVSVQVISEFLNVCRIKLGMDVPSRHKLARELIAGCNVVALEPRVVEKAMEVEAQGQISYWDALIVAAALLSGCDTLYTEDLEHGRTFDGQLTVVNPFVTI